MRKVLCTSCGSRFPESMMAKQIYPRSEYGEPAEFQRVIKGKALSPAPEQRVIYVNDQPHKLETGHYDCDLCGAKIKPGDDITCWTVWTERQQEPNLWEHQYVKI